MTEIDLPFRIKETDSYNNYENFKKKIVYRKVT